jgi:inner membrane protein
VDVLAYLDGPGGDLAFRRGWTHGLPALLVLPFVLTAVMLLFDRAVRRAGHEVLPSGVKPRQVLLLAAVSILTHPILDTLNTYGMRWLMPLRGDWFYGDTLFIADPWVWLTLGLGVALSRPRRGSRGYMVNVGRPARIALAAGGAYIVAMLLSGLAARGIARRELDGLGGAPVERLMVAPRPVTPFVRSVVALQGGVYRVGTFRWLTRPHVETATLRTFPASRPEDPPILAARATRLGRRFLGWARFPTVQVEPNPAGGSLVHLIDLRYADRPGAGFGSVTVPVAELSPKPASALPPSTTSPSPRAGSAARRR